MNKNKEHVICDVLDGSIADEMEIEPGDVLLKINDKVIEDIFDYHFFISDSFVVLLIRKPNGEEWEIEIEKDYEEDLGIVFSHSLMDEYKSCRNKCIFCFIDQLPQGMRETLYFKDDDSRLSFLQGNYVTLTNMSLENIQRIIEYKLEPINVSIHTTNPDLRCKMLNNRFAGDIMDKLRLLNEGNVELNGQIVCCPGYNDGEELIRTLRDLTQFISNMKSVCVVPFGMTKYREGLTKISPFTPYSAKKVLDTILELQKEFLNKYGTRFVFASDEWYILSGTPLPSEDEYEGYPQIENGVGMVTSLKTEIIEELKHHSVNNKTKNITKKITIATGTLVFEQIKEMCDLVNQKYPNVLINVVPIKNDFFGHHITVTGLLTGKDIINQLKDVEIGEQLLLSDTVLRDGEDVLLDDISISDIENALQTRINIVKSDGKSFVDAIITDL